MKTIKGEKFTTSINRKVCWENGYKTAIKEVNKLMKNKAKKYNHPEVFKFYSEIIQEIEGT